MERPILYSTIMVQALLDNRKKQTRRTNGLDNINLQRNSFAFKQFCFDKSGQLFAVFTNVLDGGFIMVKCPYGKRGDLLWVRETFCPTGSQEYLNASTNQPYFYKADVKEHDFVKEMMANYGWKWKPSIHMPKDAARIWLRITNVRVERLQRINYADRFDDAVAEGVSRGEDGYWIDYTSNTIKQCTPQGSFISLWKSINGEQSLSDNPWIWVVEFEVVSTTGRNNVKEVRA